MADKKFILGKQIIKAIFLVLLSLSSHYARPQNLKFSRLTASDGLSQSWVTCITQDTLGFIWIGTEIGLNRFDGEQFVIYKNDPTDSSSICDNLIRWMRIDRKGRLWIGTATGLERYDFERDIFIHYKE